MTLSEGCLGSGNDEERSEMRYVMRIAESVNHQIFERKLRSVGVPLEHASFSVVSTNLSDVLTFTYVWVCYWKVSNIALYYTSIVALR